MARRIAIWSGPRNISTAMMRSWGSRPDTFVCDEPLYAHYLEQTGVDHPGADEVLATHERDWRRVVEWLTGPVPEGRAVFYQKQMAHHLLPGIERGWLDRISHAFLIRDPAEMLASLVEKLDRPTLADTGLPQQVEIFEQMRAARDPPPVIDARDVLTDPRGVLGQLCDRLGVAFTDEMLSWPAGRRPTDGVWARHWYHAVESSTGFRPYRPKPVELPDELRPLHARCVELYDTLAVHRLRAPGGS